MILPNNLEPSQTGDKRYHHNSYIVWNGKWREYCNSWVAIEYIYKLRTYFAFSSGGIPWNCSEWGSEEVKRNSHAVTGLTPIRVLKGRVLGASWARLQEFWSLCQPRSGSHTLLSLEPACLWVASCFLHYHQRSTTIQQLNDALGNILRLYMLQCRSGFFTVVVSAWQRPTKHYLVHSKALLTHSSEGQVD